MMKRSITLNIFLIAVIVLISACSSPQNYESTAEGTILEQMLEHRIPYVGNAPGVGRLLAFLPDFDKNFTQKMFSLQTQNEPFGIVIYYEPRENWDGSRMTAIGEMLGEMAIYSEYLFESIGNLGYVEFAYRMSNSNGVLEKGEYQTFLRIYR